MFSASGFRLCALSHWVGFALLISCSWSRPNTKGLIEVPAGEFSMGSSLEERAVALELAYASQGKVFEEANAWLMQELERSQEHTDFFWVMKYPVTQLDYFIYVRDTGYAEPYIDEKIWNRAKTGHPYELAQRFMWKQGRPREDRRFHPVVLVSQIDAQNYCRWWGQQHRGRGRLPTEKEWERVARGDDGAIYPWGNEYDAALTNNADTGPMDTVSVGLFDAGKSPYGAYDMAGNVFEWTSTAHDTTQVIVKGGSWSSHGDQDRAASRHARPAELRHVTVGFRCVLQANPARRRIAQGTKRPADRP